MISTREQHEWLETDGLGGFASGTIGGIRTRRYHGLLLTRSGNSRIMLVNGLDAWITSPNGAFPLSSQRYHNEIIAPDGHQFISSFENEPWPTWRFALPNGIVIIQELFALHETSAVALSWRLESPCANVTLHVRPFLSGRDYHALHQENSVFRFDAHVEHNTVTWRPYASLPAVHATSNGVYAHEPHWYRNFHYREESARGFASSEDLAAPGQWTWTLSDAPSHLIFRASQTGVHEMSQVQDFAQIRQKELRRRQRFQSPLHRSASQFLIRGREGRTVIAGYPWFTDWGRDSFIALRGLCLATGRLAEANSILANWAGAVSKGMLPNRFPDQGDEPEFNSVDASLWFVIAAHEFLSAAEARGFHVSDDDRAALLSAEEKIIAGYAAGTRFGIRLDDDGLLAAGEHGVQLTWMDARVGDWVVTPRIGKAVEIQALWLNALWLIGERTDRWVELCARGCANFRRRFWNASKGCLYDVVDCGHQSGTADASFRPNQIFAVGGLPLMLLDAAQSRMVVDHVEQKLWTPMGLRTLAPGDGPYAPRYAGGPRERDAAYHQGTAWPWLIGPFAEAWVRVRGDTPAVRREARRRFLDPLLSHLQEAGLGHVSEVADAEAPHTPGGCPFQAWSLAELLRLQHVVLAEPTASNAAPAALRPSLQTRKGA